LQEKERTPRPTLSFWGKGRTRAGEDKVFTEHLNNTSTLEGRMKKPGDDKGDQKRGKKKT